MAKNNGHGQAEILTDAHYSRIRKAFVNPQHKLMFDIARWTGERWGAIVQLKVGDVFDGRTPKAEITFRAATRKASPDGRRETRQVPVHPVLLEALKAYPIAGEGEDWLFVSRIKAEEHVTFSAADKSFRWAVAKAGLDGRGFSTHSTRRTFITRLHERGLSIKVIQSLTGHHDLKALSRYIEITAEQRREAIGVL